VIRNSVNNSSPFFICRYVPVFQKRVTNIFNCLQIKGQAELNLVHERSHKILTVELDLQPPVV
jgi:hypothetical protein